MRNLREVVVRGLLRVYVPRISSAEGSLSIVHDLVGEELVGEELMSKKETLQWRVEVLKGCQVERMSS